MTGKWWWIFHDNLVVRIWIFLLPNLDMQGEGLGRGSNCLMTFLDRRWLSSFCFFSLLLLLIFIWADVNEPCVFLLQWISDLVDINVFLSKLCSWSSKNEIWWIGKGDEYVWNTCIILMHIQSNWQQWWVCFWIRIHKRPRRQSIRLT